MRHFCGGGVASASEPLADTLSSKGVIQAKDENGDIAARFDAEDLKKVAELADDNAEKAEDLSSKASSLENQLGGISFGLDENGKPYFSYKDENGADVVGRFDSSQVYPFGYYGYAFSNGGGSTYDTFIGYIKNTGEISACSVGAMRDLLFENLTDRVEVSGSSLSSSCGGMNRYQAEAYTKSYYFEGVDNNIISFCLVSHVKTSWYYGRENDQHGDGANLTCYTLYEKGKTPCVVGSVPSGYTHKGTVFSASKSNNGNATTTIDLYVKE